jgi:hypothetical protein
MGADLLSACIFCAGVLLGSGLAPAPGIGADIGTAYATLARSYDPGQGRTDRSNSTVKFILIGLGGNRSPQRGLGAGTPEAEWRLRVALGPSHGEQEELPTAAAGQTTANGTGRYENFAVIGRYPVSPTDSLEAAFERRFAASTDVINAGGPKYTATGQRDLSAERIDASVGLRHRWRGLEAAVSARLVRPSGSNGAAGSFAITRATLYGFGAEIRARRGVWTFLASAERSVGSAHVVEESLPDFAKRNLSPESSLEAYRLGVVCGRRFEVSLATTWDRSHLPFIALAPLGVETAAFAQGFHPDSHTRQVATDLTFRYAVAARVRVRGFLRLAYGDETVVLTDSSGNRQKLPVSREGVFGAGLSRRLGSPEATVGIGAEFSL